MSFQDTRYLPVVHSRLNVSYTFSLKIKQFVNFQLNAKTALKYIYGIQLPWQMTNVN